MTVEERLTQLERKNRRLTLAMLLTGVAAALVVMIGMARSDAVPDLVRAHRFELLDENGKMRAALGVDKDGPGLVLRDQNEKARAALAVYKKGSGLDLTDEAGKVRAALVVDKKGPWLALLDENEKVRATLDATKDGSGLELRDENGRVLRHLP